MKYTCKAKDILRFRRIVSKITRRHYGKFCCTTMNGQAAFHTSGTDWTVVSSISGRKPTKAFSIPFSLIENIPYKATGNVTFEFQNDLKPSCLSWTVDGKVGFIRFETYCDTFAPRRLPALPLPQDVTSYPVSVLDQLEKCSSIAQGSQFHVPHGPQLHPDGTLYATDASVVMAVKSGVRFPWKKKISIEPCNEWHWIVKKTYAGA